MPKTGCTIMKIKSLLVASATMASIVACPAFASPTYYTDRAAFDAATGGGLNFESFEADFGTAATIPFGGFPVGGFSVSETGDGIENALYQTTYPGLFHEAITDEDKALYYASYDGSITTFSFPSPITAFGLDITTTPGSNVYIDGDAYDYLELTEGKPAFWGITDSKGITSIIFEAQDVGTYVGFDSVSYGKAQEIQKIAVDVKFCDDPNFFNCKQSGVLPVTIFGTDDFEVEDIDMSTLRLCLADLSVCTDVPRSLSIADRGNPNSDLGASMCTVDPDTGEEHLNRDGFPDLDATFEVSEVKAMLAGFCSLYKTKVSGTFIITGLTLDDTLIRSAPLPNTGVDQLVKKNR